MTMKIERHNPHARLPTYSTPGSVGMDLYVCKQVIIAAGATLKIPMGIGIELPLHCEGQIRPRSSLSAKGLDVTIGTIDNDYRGELNVVVHNRNIYPFIVSAGDRIAQLVVSPVEIVSPQWADSLSKTERGADGFGSTGR